MTYCLSLSLPCPACLRDTRSSSSKITLRQLDPVINVCRSPVEEPRKRVRDTREKGENGCMDGAGGGRDARNNWMEGEMDCDSGARAAGNKESRSTSDAATLE